MDQAVCASYAGNLTEAISIAELILELTGRTGDKALEAQCCAGLAYSKFVLGNGLRPDLIEPRPRWSAAVTQADHGPSPERRGRTPPALDR